MNDHPRSNHLDDFKRFFLLGVTLLAATALAAESPTFRVTENLTLGEISRILYGTVKRAKDIAAMNRLKNPDLIRVGQILRLPGAPVQSATEQAKELDRVHAKRAEKTVASPELSRTTKRIENAPRLDSARHALTTYLAEQEVTKAPNEKEAKLALIEGEKNLGVKNFADAAKFFETARKKNPDELSAWIEEIRAYRENNQPILARESAQLFVSRFPDLAEIPFIRENITGESR